MNEKTSKITLIGWMISIIIPAVIGTISVSQNFTKELKTFFIITIFIILIIAFELLPKLIASVLLPALYMISGLVPAEVAYASWTSTTVWMVLGGLVLSAVLEECGLLKRIALCDFKMWWNLQRNGIWMLYHWDHFESDHIL